AHLGSGRTDAPRRPGKDDGGKRLRRAQCDAGGAALMRTAKTRSIVNISSLAGRRGVSPLGGYSSTKFALVGMTEALRVELFNTGIKVSLVMPGVIDTPMARDALKGDSLKGVSDMM